MAISPTLFSSSFRNRPTQQFSFPLETSANGAQFSVSRTSDALTAGGRLEAQYRNFVTSDTGRTEQRTSASINNFIDTSSQADFGDDSFDIDFSFKADSSVRFGHQETTTNQRGDSSTGRFEARTEATGSFDFVASSDPERTTVGATMDTSVGSSVMYEHNLTGRSDGGSTVDATFGTSFGSTDGVTAGGLVSRDSDSTQVEIRFGGRAAILGGHGNVKVDITDEDVGHAAATPKRLLAQGLAAGTAAAESLGERLDEMSAANQSTQDKLDSRAASVDPLLNNLARAGNTILGLGLEGAGAVVDTVADLGKVATVVTAAEAGRTANDVSGFVGRMADGPKERVQNLYTSAVGAWKHVQALVGPRQSDEAAPTQEAREPKEPREPREPRESFDSRAMERRLQESRFERRESGGMVTFGPLIVMGVVGNSSMMAKQR